MPQGKRSNKKKKAKERNLKAIKCNGCSTPLNKKDYHNCICTKVRYCAASCKENHPHVDCPGPPRTQIDLNKQLERLRAQDGGGVIHPDQEKLLLDTVTQPTSTYLQENGVFGTAMTAEDYASLADEGTDAPHLAFAYLAASSYKHRILGEVKVRQGGGRAGTSTSRLFVDNSKPKDNLSVLKAEELAFRYFEKAGKLGHVMSMQSLGECYLNGIGCKKNGRYALEWYWRSTLGNYPGAMQVLESKSQLLLLPLEIEVQIRQLAHAKPMLRQSPGHSFILIGPNLGSLMTMLFPVIESLGYSLPPFAGIEPTGAVGSQPGSPATERQSRVPLIGYDKLRRLKREIDASESRGNPIMVGYGRRGTAKTGTAQSVEGAYARCIDCQLFLVPPAPGCDETVTQDDIYNWVDKVHQNAMMSQTQQQPYDSGPYMEPLWVICVHSENDPNPAQRSKLACRECTEAAAGRLRAVANGSVMLCVDEALPLPHHGQAVIFRETEDGPTKMETWKTYSRAEAETVLAIIAAADNDVYTSPLFLAQDPNLFWPLIFDHGCIRAALEFVAPHMDWNKKLGSIKPPRPQIPLVVGANPGCHFEKCGNDLCTSVIAHKSKQFQYCTGCNRREYCSTDCQLVDWKLHSRECKAAASGSVPPPLSVVPDLTANDATNEESGRGKNEPRHGETVVVHSLKSQAQYNQHVGLVGEKAEEERCAITITMASGVEKQISIKQSNLYTIDAFCKKRKKKSDRYECYEHGLEVCGHCYFDFSLCNSLLRLKRAGTDICNPETIHNIMGSHYASIGNLRTEECTTTDEGWPMECHGMGSHPRLRFVLAALLQAKGELSLLALVARASIVCIWSSHPPCSSGTHQRTATDRGKEA